MKAYGRKQFIHNFKDNHPPKGNVNWWENQNIKSKKRERERSKNIIETYIEEQEVTRELMRWEDIDKEDDYYDWKEYCSHDVKESFDMIADKE
jgi:hypothetical protein